MKNNVVEEIGIKLFERTLIEIFFYEKKDKDI